jgi:hypothetical protein
MQAANITIAKIVTKRVSMKDYHKCYKIIDMILREYT